jgi:predicted patatin/cPLA2 family phospholipase
MVIEKFAPDAKIIGIHYEPNTIVGKDQKLLSKSYLMKPSKPLPITSFDYTNPKGVRDTYELGKSDAIAQKDAILDYLRKA